MLKFKLIFLASCLLLSTTISAQSWPIRVFNKMFNDTTITGKPKFIAYPTLAYAPETSWEIGVSGLLVYNSKQDTANRVSEIGGSTFITLEKQYGANFDHALYSDKNNWFFLGKFHARSYPLPFFGIGTDIEGEELAITHANFILIRERILRKVYKHWYLGLEIDYERLSKVRFDWLDETRDNIAPLGSDGYGNLGLGLGVVYDTRHNVLNVRHGLLSEVGYLMYRKAWGSTNNLNTLFIDTRAFKNFGERNVLAGQFIGQFSSGEVPFNQLSMIGGEVMMRGYYLGKYRDNNLISAQAEFRCLPFKFSKRIGGAVFAAVGSVAPELNFNKLLWTTGGGLRILLFPNRDIYTRLDVGINPDGYGVYLFIGEAF